MNRTFKTICNLILYGSVLFLILPFLSIVQKGFGFFISLPYPKETIFALKLSVKTSLISSILCTVVTILVVYSLESKKYRLKKFLVYLLSIPLGIPHLVIGLALLSFLGQKGLGRYLSLYLNMDFVYNPMGIILAQYFVNLPFSIQNFSNIYGSLDTRLLFTARNLGLNELRVFIHVIIPMLKRQILCLAMINFSRALGEFGAVMILVGVTRMRTETLATSIFLNMSTGDFETAAGTSIILILVSIITMLIFYKLMEEDGENVRIK